MILLFQENIMADNNEILKTEISELKEEVRNISAKVDQVLQMLSDFTIMLMEDPEEEEEGYEDSWVPEEDDFWKNEDD
jgi:hypothetical protein